METREPADEPRTAPPSLRARLTLWLVLSVVAVHTAVVALWVAPFNLLQESVGTARVSSYILPVWDQAWSVFAPQTDTLTDRYQVRALVGSGKGQVATDWAPVTAKEVVASVRHHPFPSRTVLITTRLAGGITRTFNALTEAQKQVVHDAGAEVSVADLGQRLRSASTSPSELSEAGAFLQAETGTEYFLSGIARAIWGGKVVAIQFRKDRIVTGKYGTSQPRQIATAYSFYSNWRPVGALTAEERDAFTKYAHEFDLGAVR